MAARLTYLDTHVVAWLYATGAEMLSPRAARAVANDDLRISPMVRLELRYLHEIGRLRETPQPVIEELTAKLGLRVCPAAFSAVVLAAEAQTWTRDPFDRLIVAQAALHDAGLVTRDDRIAAHYPRTIW